MKPYFGECLLKFENLQIKFNPFQGRNFKIELFTSTHRETRNNIRGKKIELRCLNRYQCKKKNKENRTEINVKKRQRNKKERKKENKKKIIESK